MSMRHLAAASLIACLLATPAGARSGTPPVAVVAAENFYGDVAGQLGGPGAQVTSILNNPDQDPHLFEASPSVARRIAAARIVVENGVDYDPWMGKLLDASRTPGRRVIVLADLVHKMSRAIRISGTIRPT